MWKILKKKNEINKREQLIVDNEKLTLGSTLSGKTRMLIKGFDLYDLLTVLKDKQITIKTGKQTLYKGIACDYNCKRVEYVVIHFEKILCDNSYSIIVKKI